MGKGVRPGLSPHMVIFKVFPQFNYPVLCPAPQSHSLHLVQKVLPQGGLLTGGCGHVIAIIITTGFQFWHARAELSILHGLSQNQAVINPATIQGASNTDIQSERPGRSCNACRFHP